MGEFFDAMRASPDVATVFGDLAGMGVTTDVVERFSDLAMRASPDVATVFGDLAGMGVTTDVALDPSLIHATDYSPVGATANGTLPTPGTPPRLESFAETWRNLSPIEQLAVAWAALLLTLLPYTVQAALNPGSKYNPLEALAGSGEAALVQVVAGLVILVIQHRRT